MRGELLERCTRFRWHDGKQVFRRIKPYLSTGMLQQWYKRTSFMHTSGTKHAFDLHALPDRPICPPHLTSERRVVFVQTKGNVSSD